ncbi:hypothetical protein CC2G_003943 [Coprinopsis cinerea AmutBmut pab1-1]|nr:hypothetical protein CC2G_003943 [Coprinopsis cinerea AmutBmut pab1-1]
MCLGIQSDWDVITYKGLGTVHVSCLQALSFILILRCVDIIVNRGCRRDVRHYYTVFFSLVNARRSPEAWALSSVLRESVDCHGDAGKHFDVVVYIFQILAPPTHGFLWCLIHRGRADFIESSDILIVLLCRSQYVCASRVLRFAYTM